MAKTTETLTIIISIVFGVVGVGFGLQQCADSQRLRKDNEILQRKVEELIARADYFEDGMVKSSWQVSNLNASVDSLTRLVSMTSMHLKEDMDEKLGEKLINQPTASPAYISPSYSKAQSDIENQNSEIIVSSTGGIYWVIIGYSSTAEDAERQANLARSRGFKNAWYNEPIRGNPYYGIYAAGNLSWDAAVKLRDLAKNTFYGSEAWIWQP